MNHKAPSRFFNRTKKPGLPPGTVTFSGAPNTTPVSMSLFDYDEAGLDEMKLESADASLAYRGKKRITWIDIDGVHDTEIVRSICAHHDVHPLVVEDIVHTEQRPKIENFGDHIYVVIKMLYFDSSTNTLTSEQVSIIIGKDFVLSFQERPGDVFDPVRQRLRQGKGLMRSRKSDYIAYSLIDVIVDHYFVILEQVGEEIESLEGEIFERSGIELLSSLGKLRREMIVLRKAVWPVRELISSLERLDSPLIAAKTKPYLRDAYDHAIQVIDIVESLRDLIGVLRDSYQAHIGNKMNEIMKVLTIIATIFIPLTFIAGIYGMNFANMPELTATYGYPIAMGSMLAIGLTLGMFFKWKKWM